MRFFIFLFFLLFANLVLADLIKPNPNLLPQEVISIQLLALKNNNQPYSDAGIEQTWEFAHPSNRKYTGPLFNFKKMMYSNNYSLILNHIEHNIISVRNDQNISFFFVEIFDKTGNKFGFQWIVQKVLFDEKFNNCWMTISVSEPILLSKTT